MTFQPVPPEADSPAPAAWKPPLAAASLYAGKVMHARLKPTRHRFTYRVFSLLIDLDRLDEADRMSRLFSVNRANIVSFRESDHVDGEFASIKAYALSLLQRAGLEEAPARVTLACYPRMFGYVFNPLSVYHAYAADGRVLALIYEVRNTFGDRHTYVCPVDATEVSPAGIRQSCGKVFHVSPFIPMAMRYHFRMVPPRDEMRWRILVTDEDGPLLSATYSAGRVPLTTPRLAALLVRTMAPTWKTIAGIHFEALRLWLKGMKYIPRPTPPSAVSFKKDNPASHAR